MNPQMHIEPARVFWIIAGAVAAVFVVGAMFATTDTTFSSNAPRQVVKPSPPRPQRPPPPPQPSTELEVEVEACTVSEYHTRTTGTVRNVGKTTVHFVTVETRWYDSAGEVVDTGNTYAVGSERLRPGETSRFEAYSRAGNVDRCGASLMGWELVE